MNAMSDEEQQEMTSQYGVIAMWSFIDDNEALAVLGAFSTDREDEMYFSLIADDKIKSDHGFWLARTLRKTFQKTYDLAQYSVATMHCDVGDPLRQGLLNGWALNPSLMNMVKLCMSRRYE
jgi:hypothetical protein